MVYECSKKASSYNSGFPAEFLRAIERLYLNRILNGIQKAFESFQTVFLGGVVVSTRVP